MTKLSQNFYPFTNERLLTIWKGRYAAKLTERTLKSTNLRTYPLEFAASETGRRKTIGKISISTLKAACHAAAARTQTIYTRHEYLNFNGTVDLAKFTLQTFPILLQYYQTQPPLIIISSPDKEDMGQVAIPVVQFGISEISRLANDLETHLLKFQAQCKPSKDWGTQLFLTSQISLTSSSLLNALDPVEQAMFKPYCDLLEEYVAIPWQRLCLAAANYNHSAPRYQLVERMLGDISDISLATYDKWATQFDTYASARGGLSDPKIRRSSLRDLDMFQVYLWLCLLQGDLAAITQELVVFCVVVFKGIGIPWHMTVAGTRLLLDEILDRLTADEKAIATYLINGMMNAILTAESQDQV